jgi:HipA-like protein
VDEMKRAKVFWKGELAGTLMEADRDTYIFKYYSTWLDDDTKPAISLTFPKTQQEFTSNHLFPFFYNMLSEGFNKESQCKTLQIDESDYFELLISTAHTDTIGAVTVKRFE